MDTITQPLTYESSTLVVGHKKKCVDLLLWWTCTLSRDIGQFSSDVDQQPTTIRMFLVKNHFKTKNKIYVMMRLNYVFELHQLSWWDWIMCLNCTILGSIANIVGRAYCDISLERERERERALTSNHFCILISILNLEMIICVSCNC